MNKIDILPKLEWTNLKIYSDQDMSVLLTSDSVKQLAQEYLPGINIIETVLIESASEEYARKLPKPSGKIKRLYAFGGGRVIDIARFLASSWGLDFIAIPTIISSDAFLVNCTGVRNDGCVTYIPSTPASYVYLDWELLQQSPLKYHVSGCGDVLSIFTGLHDWKYVNKIKAAQSDEIYDSSVDLMALGILDGLLSMSEEIKTGSYKGINSIITTLAMEVQLCYFYGNSRPEEGGEHFFTYCVESKLSHFLHGEMVGFGILLTGYLQNQDITQIKKFMDTVGLNYRPKGITQKIVKETLTELPEYVVKHNLRYSIYNNFDISKEAKNLEQFFTKIQIEE